MAAQFQNGPEHVSDDTATAGAEPSAPVVTGAWLLVQHWRGPVVQVAKVTPKRIALVGGGYVESTDVKAAFATEQDADAALARYRAAWRAAQGELKTFEEARKAADAAYNAAEGRLKADAWLAAMSEPRS